jgi:hypothetical protein
VKLISILAFSIAMASLPADASALRRVSDAKASLPLGGLEPNQGQATPGVLFLNRGYYSLAVKGSSILFSPQDVELSLIGGRINPGVEFSNRLPGVVNSLTGPDSKSWATGIPRYATGRVSEILPGVNAEYTADADGALRLRLLCAAGVSPKEVVFEVRRAAGVERTPAGTLQVRLGPSRMDPFLLFPAPTAFQSSGVATTSRAVRYAVQSSMRFGFDVQGVDISLPLSIEIRLTEARLSPGYTPSRSVGLQVNDTVGNIYAAAELPDGAGKEDPFPNLQGTGCGLSMIGPVPCMDVAVYKFSRSGELIFVSYLSGRINESLEFLEQAPDGGLVVTGTTSSLDFPVTVNAFQGTFGGPVPAPVNGESIFEGDLFAVKLDSATGIPFASTFFGGESADQIGKTALGSDGSVYFLPKWLGRRSPKMPSARGALKPECDDPCVNGYAARLSPSLDSTWTGAGDGRAA